MDIISVFGRVSYDESDIKVSWQICKFYALVDEVQIHISKQVSKD